MLSTLALKSFVRFVTAEDATATSAVMRLRGQQTSYSVKFKVTRFSSINNVVNTLPSPSSLPFGQQDMPHKTPFGASCLGPVQAECGSCLPPCLVRRFFTTFPAHETIIVTVATSVNVSGTLIVTEFDFGRPGSEMLEANNLSLSASICMAE